MFESVRSFGGDRATAETNTVIEFPRVNTTPLVENYAEHSLQEDFDVAEILFLASVEGNLPIGHHIYLVDFASLRNPGVNEEEYLRLDDPAHREAKSSPGFLLYFRGDGYSQGFCRSFCAWRSIQEAIDAAGLPKHKQAEDSAEYLYSWFKVTMREAWLVVTDEGLDYEFGPEHTRSHGEYERPLAV